MLRWLNRYAAWALPCGLAVGLLLQDLAALLRPSVTPLIFLLTLAGFLRVDWRQISAALRQPIPALGATLAILVGSPVLLAALLPWLPQEVGLALLLQSVAPPIGSAPVMAVMAGLEGGFALVVSVAATVLAVVTLPPMLDAFAGIAVEIEPARLALRLLALIGGAVVVASLIRRLAGHRLAALAPEVGGVTVIVMVLFAIAVMDGLVVTAVADPIRVIRLTLVAIVAAIVWAGIACLITWRFAGPTRALTFGLLAGNRNLGLVLGALGAAAPGEFTVYLAVAQLPIYLVPAVFGALARLAIRSRSPS